MDNEIAVIALYLNLALPLIRANGNKPHYLTGNTDGSALPQPGSQNQETQCMLVGSSLWIANNDDADTATQRALLNRLGINRLSKLSAHVEAFCGRVLPTHAGKYNPGAFTLKHKALYALMPAGQRTAPPGAYTKPMPGGVENVAFNLGGVTTNLQNCSRLVFVSGNYNGTGGNKYHAEQKLLAALGELWSHWTYRQPVYIQGCKPACTRCDQVLQDVNLRITPSSGKRFSYVNSVAASTRSDVGLNQVTTDAGVKALDLDTYFPA